MLLNTENRDQNLQTRDDEAERKLSHSFLRFLSLNKKDTHQLKPKVRRQQLSDQTCAAQELLRNSCSTESLSQPAGEMVMNQLTCEQCSVSTDRDCNARDKQEQIEGLHTNREVLEGYEQS